MIYQHATAEVDQEIAKAVNAHVEKEQRKAVTARMADDDGTAEGAAGAPKWPVDGPKADPRGRNGEGTVFRTRF